MASCDVTDELNCSICLCLYTSPVSLTCGHSFCRECIDRALKLQEGADSYTCPSCRKSYSKKPQLLKNISLRNIAQRLQSAPNLHGRLSIFCTYCIVSPVPAVKYCLLCEASLCDDHLRVHSKSPKHALCELSTRVGVRACPFHREVLHSYCRQDATCVCTVCIEDEDHVGHQLEPLPEASEKKKENLKKVLEKLTSKNDETKKKIRHMKRCTNVVQDKVSGVTKRVGTVFRDIKKQIEDLEVKLMVDISKKREEALMPVSVQMQQLQMQKEEQSRRMRHVEELRDSTDPLTVLQEQETDNYGFCDTTDTLSGDEQLYDGGVLDQDFISETLYSNLIDIVTGISKWFSVQAPTKFSLDLNTAANNIYVSRNLKFASWSERNGKRPENPARFQSRQVMSLESISAGRHYWDVEVDRDGHWRIGMCYPSIERTGDHSYIGNNNRSWCICCKTGAHDSVMHNGEEIFLPCKVSSGNLRIWVDYEAGQISFYDFGEPVKHLHTFTTTITEPLYAAFYMWKDVSRDSIRIIT